MTQMYDSGFQQLAVRLSTAEDASDLSLVERIFAGRLPGKYAIVALASRGPGPESATLPADLARSHFVPYFSHQTLYFLELGVQRGSKRAVDYTVTLDSNAAHHVNRIVSERSVNGLPKRVSRTFEALLNDELNFDSFFYLIENIKQGKKAIFIGRGRKAISPFRAWLRLNRSFRKNLVAVHHFNAINSAEFRRTGQITFSRSYLVSFRMAVRVTNEFYGSPRGIELINGWILPLHRLLVWQLLAMYNIEFGHKSSSRRKMSNLVEFIQDRMGAYLDRETMLGYMYFRNRQAVPLFLKVNRGMPISNLMGTVSNIAWDLLVPRMMERVLGEGLQGDYGIPFFLTFDEALARALRSFPVKAVIVDRDSGNSLPLPEVNSFEFYEEEGCGDLVRPLFDADSVRARDDVRKGVSRTGLVLGIAREYRELRIRLAHNTGTTK